MNVQDQKLWVGPDFDPSSTNRPDDEFCGFANLVADQTPVLGTDFVTHFNPGNGYKIYENGAVIGMESGWHNRFSDRSASDLALDCRCRRRRKKGGA